MAKAAVPTDNSPANQEGPDNTDVLSEDMVVEQVPSAPEVVETVTYYSPDPEPEDAISLEGLLLAEFYGRQYGSASPMQHHVTALEDFLRSHAVGGSNRNSEGFYGPKTRELVRTAVEHYLFTDGGNGVPDRALMEALKLAGAKVTG